MSVCELTRIRVDLVWAAYKIIYKPSSRKYETVRHVSYMCFLPSTCPRHYIDISLTPVNSHEKERYTTQV